MSDRNCAHCSGPLPPKSQRNRVYCSRHCTNAATWARDPAGRAAANKAWRDETREARAARRLSAKPIRYCAECSTVLPGAANARRRYCSRACINVKSLREALAQRLEATRRRRARLRAATGPGVSERDWRRLCNRYGDRCAYCDARAPLTMDHVVPLIRGGGHCIGNILPACRSCNSAKRDDFLAHWRRGISAARCRQRVAHLTAA